MRAQHYQLSISGMQCADCENNIEEAVTALPGVIGARADFTHECLVLDLDVDVISLKTVCAAIKTRGYQCSGLRGNKQGGAIKRIGTMVAALLGIALLLQLNRFIDIGYSLEQINANAGYGVVFLIGVLTSFHCIGMCGGFVLSYTTGDVKPGRPPFINHALYGIGKTLSYASFGALFGLIGGAVSFSVGMRSGVMALAGLFLILYGLSLLDAFAALRRFHLRLPRFLAQRMSLMRRHSSNPLTIGLLNGLMIACGPLQAMYIMAAGVGSPFYGAALLSVFALGTLPVMFVFGLLSTLMTANATQRLLRISGLIILLMGAVMLNRSMLLSGTGYDVSSMVSRLSEPVSGWIAAAVRRDESDIPLLIQEGYQVIYTEAEKYQYIPSRYVLRTGIPVKWIINVKELSPCNQQIVVADLKMAIDLKAGLQMVEFLPKTAGVISWSCSMGMIPGSFIVKD